MAESSLDPVLSVLSYEVIEMLHWFAKGNSFKEVGAQFGCDERTVSRQLLDLDEAFSKTKQAHLLERPTRGRGYQLSAVGRVFVDLLEPITQATRGAIDAAAASTRFVQVVCTSNCIDYFHQLTDVLPMNRTFDPVPVARRTAEVDLARPLETRVCMSSVLMSRSQNPAVGTVRAWNHYIEMLPLSVDAIYLLSREDLGFRRPISVRQLFDGGVTFITPPGGVVWDFLNNGYPEWRRLRPFQHISATDLDFGLKCLTAINSIPRFAMVVHGLEREFLKRYSLEHARLVEFGNDGSDDMVAVTAVFYSRDDSETDGSPYEVIWDAAKALWAEKERLI
jgi:hypothetical protein